MGKPDPFAKPPRYNRGHYSKMGKNKKAKRFPYVSNRYISKYIVSRISPGNKPYINPERKRRKEEKNKKRKNIEEKFESRRNGKS